MTTKQFAVIGMGRFGRSIAETLTEMGHQVLAIDKDEAVIEDVSKIVTHAVVADCTEESTIKSLGLRNFDVAVVAVGNDIRASIMTSVLIKEAGVKFVLARAQDELHAKILYKVGVDKVVLPERDIGVRIAHNLVSANVLDFIELSNDYSLAEMIVPAAWVGKTLKELDVRSKYGINVMAIKTTDDMNISPRAQDLLLEHNVLVMIASTAALTKLENDLD